ncbi:CACTA en-spm transposon protein [Cucumis melo var. makuwa]|uniref:CACTA en-spm transposon protein n=1 Tax=Cucumis melo var. makuwa TaxID=1194695 RepID=A0A5A7ULT0_CUCMM|nr:CACTA en-spm transposon protein [Cucumis melo var. makuwa]TYJ95722.1 CACTA en-spm transposon protein [Cucumis melo var. makuwa]
MKVLSRVDRYRYSKALFVGFTPSFGLRSHNPVLSLKNSALTLMVVSVRDRKEIWRSWEKPQRCHVPRVCKGVDNPVGLSSSVGDNLAGSSQPSATPTPRKCTQSQLLEFERYVATNGQILMMITPCTEKPISPHAISFSQAIGVYVLKTFSVRCLKFVEHQMLNTFKEFQGDCHRHFKKYSNLEEACANPLHLLIERNEDQHYLCDHYMSCAF